MSNETCRIDFATMERFVFDVFRGMGVPEAWCRLGAGLAHILIDEFQDTAVEQWEVLRLLALECLARGGTLYLVVIEDGKVGTAAPVVGEEAGRGGQARDIDQILDADRQAIQRTQRAASLASCI